MIYLFNTTKVPTLSEVGGKAKALIETTGAGFPVPEGMALSVEFFTPWLKEIKASDEWAALLANETRETWEVLKSKAAQFEFTG